MARALLTTLRFASKERDAAIKSTIYGHPEDADLAKRYRDDGCERIVINLAQGKADEVLPHLDRIAAIIRAVNG